MPTDFIAKNTILTAALAGRKLRRMAFQVAENNEGEKEIIIAGVQGNGVVVAQSLLAELEKIVTIPLHFITINLNKKEPLDVTIDAPMDFTDKNIIVVDDVANSGKTLLYAIKPFLNYLPRKIQTLVLVERSHKQFSIQPDYVGLSLTTTLQEHITVETDGHAVTGAWLH